MKKIKGLLLALLVFLFGTNMVSAVCDTTEENRLRSLATNVKTSYEVVQEEAEPGSFTPPDGLTEEEIKNYKAYNTVVYVYVTNITEDLTVDVTDSSGNTKNYKYADTKNGTLTIKETNIATINKYTIAVNGNSKDCAKTRLKTLEIKTPKYNEYSSYHICQDNKEYYMCYEYIDFDLGLTENEFYKKIDKYIASKNKKEQEKEKEENKGFIDFLKENKTSIIIVSIIIIGAGVGTTVVIIKRRRRVV